MKPRALFALFGLLFLLFGCSLVIGAFNAGQAAEEIPPAGVEALAGLLVRDRPLSADDITQANPAACLLQFQQGTFVIPAAVTCTFAVNGGGPAVRTLSLRLVQGATAALILEPAGDRSLTARHTLNGTQSQATVQVFEEGGILAVSCLGGGQAGGCRLQIDD